jgi:tRNA modification GTPase
VIRELFRPRTTGSLLPVEPSPGHVWLGRVGTGLSEEVVLCAKELAPVPWLELHCHGGPAAVQLLLDTLAEEEVETCRWQDLGLPGAQTLYECEALEALGAAPTTRTAAILLDQYHGAFRHALADTIAAFAAGAHKRATKVLERLAGFASLGRHLTQPWRVVVAGAPNVGKSSLVNAVLGFTRCLVASMPGTTRDVVTAVTALDGWPVELGDTAGVRESADALERAGIALAESAARQADLCLWVLDGSTEPVCSPLELSSPLVVVNKSDLTPVWNWEELSAVRVSAWTGEGIASLCEAITQRLVPELPAAGEPVPFTESLCTQIEAAWQLAAAREWEKSRLVLETARHGIGHHEP